MQTRRTVITGIAALASAPAMGAAPVRGVVELFTSQGCSSCPPADRLAAELAQDRSLVVLTLPVEIWDTLGWRDTLAQHRFTERQRAYAAARRAEEVYTPQAVVNGGGDAVGSDRDAILRLARGLPVAVGIRGTTASIGADVSGALRGGEATVIAVPVWRARAVAIGRGENARAQVTYINVVRALIPIGRWHGAALDLTLPAMSSADEGLAVLVQAGSDVAPGAILGAAFV